MRLSQIYATGKPVISVEFFPPRTPEGEADLAARIPEIAALKPDFCSVTYGAGGTDRNRTLQWVHRIKHEYGLEVMCHLTCVGQSKQEIDEILTQLQADGVQNIIALRGDPPRGNPTWQPHPAGYHYASELVAAARARGFSIAVAGFPEVHPESPTRQSDLTHLRHKVDAGADAIITQLFFDNEDYYSYVNQAREAGINIPIIPGILPFRSEEELRRFTTKYARTANGPARVPRELEDQITAAGPDLEKQAQVGLNWAIHQSAQLLKHGAPGIHYYCMNKSNIVEAILTALRTQNILT